MTQPTIEAIEAARANPQLCSYLKYWDSCPYAAIVLSAGMAKVLGDCVNNVNPNGHVKLYYMTDLGKAVRSAMQAEEVLEKIT